MNSDKRLDELLDSVKSPALSEDFHQRLFEQTAPAREKMHPLRRLFSNLLAYPRLPEMALATAVLIIAGVLFILPAGQKNSDIEEIFLSEHEGTELLWLFGDEESDESEIEDISLLDNGLSELYALHD